MEKLLNKIIQNLLLVNPLKIILFGSYAKSEFNEESDDDLRLIQKIIDDESLTNMIAYHSQQAIEKSLKSVLEEYESKVPRIHNIIKLKEMTEK